MTSYISFFNAQSGPIPTSLGLITPLETFDVESNAMEGDLFQPEYSGPDGLKNLVNFRASLNNFRGVIPTEIGLWTKLQTLWFADNEIAGTIPAEIGNLVDMSKSKIFHLDCCSYSRSDPLRVCITLSQIHYSSIRIKLLVLSHQTLVTSTI